MLGIGTGATLAAWTDTEVASGGFSASVFGTESQSAGSPTYASNTAAPGASLTFNASAMSPGVSYYAYLNVRTTAASTVGGTITRSEVLARAQCVWRERRREPRAARPQSPGARCSSRAVRRRTRP